jgi:hypothetical protein
MLKRSCKATTAKGEACKARPLRDSEFCLLHSPDHSPAAIGARGGRGRGKQPGKLELNEDGVPADLDAWSDRRLFELGNQNSNVAGGVAAIKELAARRQSHPSSRAGYVSNEDARVELMRLVKHIASAHAFEAMERKVCPTCGQSTAGQSVMARVVGALAADDEGVGAGKVGHPRYMTPADFAFTGRRLSPCAQHSRRVGCVARLGAHEHVAERPAAVALDRPDRECLHAIRPRVVVDLLRMRHCRAFPLTRRIVQAGH